MSEMKHTPGPWSAMDENGKYNSNHEWSVSDDDANTSEAAPIFAGGRPVAFAVYSCNGFYSGSSPSVDANARLIAAAPDLLSSLRALYEAQDSCVDLTPEVMRAARDAIAKATGPIMTSDDLAKEMYEALKEYYSTDPDATYFKDGISTSTRYGRRWKAAGDAIQKYEQAHTIPLEDEKGG